MPSKRKNSSRSASAKKAKKEEISAIEPTKEEISVNEPTKEEIPDNEPTKEEISDNEPIKEEIVVPTKEDEEEEGPESRFIGDQVPDVEARRRWPDRYQEKKKGRCVDSKGKDETEERIQAKRHFTQAEVDGCIIFNLDDDAHVKAGPGEDYFICKVVEMFEAIDGSPYFTAQWYYRAKDTVIESSSHLIDDKRVFYSEIKDDNPLDCLVEKLKIVRLPLHVDVNEATISSCHYYCNMKYLLPFLSYLNLQPDNSGVGSETDSTISGETDVAGSEEVSQAQVQKTGMFLLDLYSGCGAMSTGLCLGANMSGVNLVTKWAVDINKHACDSLKLNHPETEVRNEAAEDFLSLLREWEKLCISFSLIGCGDSEEPIKHVNVEEGEVDAEEEADDDDENNDAEIFEVEKILAICYGDPNGSNKTGLYFKIRWKGYGPAEDTWEPIDGLSDCPEKIKEFVTNGFKSHMLPLPGNADVICGGPPCQGISGFNRFRNTNKPLDDPKNKQLVVYMDIVNFLKPRFVLMENVVDIIKFSGAFLGRYALGRLVGMNYQTRMGMMAAGAYGLPQFRMRVFLWGARPSEKLPQYPLPTHNLINRGVIPLQFEACTVGFDDFREDRLKKALLLGDAISDLPKVENNESRDEMSYDCEPQTEFQKFIRLRKEEMLSCSTLGEIPERVLFDHRPLQLNDDDYQRVCKIPKRKGANFRDLEGVRVRADKKVEWDPDVERVYLKSGKPLVPDYAMSFVGGSSSKPFGRLWWDETVPTVVTRAEPHNQTILHPLQDRVLTIRENARLQGFPDYYKLLGPIKERYIQVGNAVAVPVASALGCSLAMAFQGTSGDDPLFTLPEQYPNINMNTEDNLCVDVVEDGV